ncbi:CDP-alcohol phosphatidyltransferase family protein [Candidatus Micrarchaeota archaeon]|nr:CDP-alcohol phosphatidyltransferase family protein [Candidatus Micrarchaeota archaeon]
MLKQNISLKQMQESIGKLLAVIPLSPNHWTFLSVVLALAGGVLVAYNELVAGLAFFALAGLFDVIDGAVARARKEVSKLGGFVDGVADRFVEAIFLFSFMFYQLPEIFIDAKIWLAGVIFLGTCMPSFIRAYADHKEVISKKKALELGGICERSERVLIIIIGLVFGIFYGMDYFVYGLIVASILSLITIVQRLLQILR